MYYFVFFSLFVFICRRISSCLKWLMGTDHQDVIPLLSVQETSHLNHSQSYSPKCRYLMKSYKDGIWLDVFSLWSPENLCIVPNVCISRISSIQGYLPVSFSFYKMFHPYDARKLIFSVISLKWHDPSTSYEIFT